MPNILNKMMKEEVSAVLNDAADCVVVDFQGLTVEKVNEFRSSLYNNDISMQVVKTSLARQVLGELGREGYKEMFVGPSAVIWGGTDIVQLTKTVHDFAKKNKVLKFKGGFLDNEAISKEDVVRLTNVPDMPILLGGIAAAIGAPVQGFYNGLNSLFSSILYAIDAVREKVEKGGDA